MTAGRVSPYSKNLSHSLYPVIVKSEQLKPTKRCLRQPESRRYLTPNGGWSPDIGQARDFPSIFQALEVCCREQMHSAELVFHFGDGRYELSLPLGVLVQ